MCGIAGVRRYGTNPITSEEVKVLLAELEHRGNHATGIALMHKGRIHICKAPRPAWAFIAEKETDDFLDAFLPEATMAILHTRFATIGNPENNENNHPMFFGNTAVVHNGGIQNHQMMFDQLKVPRSCQTDSDVFRAILDKDGMNEAAIKDMNRLSGSAAIAAISQESPDLLVLARSGSPLVYGMADDKLWWASTMGAIQRAVRPWGMKHGLLGRKSRGDIYYFGVPDHTAYILNNEGLVGKFEFKTCAHYNAPTYRMRETYNEKTTQFKKENRTRRLVAGTGSKPAELTHKSTKCPRAACDTIIVLPREEKFTGYLCPDCSTRLDALDRLTDKEMTFQEAPPKGENVN